MPKKRKCIDPSVGKNIDIYNENALLSEEERKLSLEQQYDIEAHIFRCPFCRSKLTLAGKLEFKFKLIIAGVFIEDPKLREERKNVFKKYLQGKISYKKFKENWPKLSEEERERIEEFLES